MRALPERPAPDRAALVELAGGGHRKRVLADLGRWGGLVIGRGACGHPDGTVRFVRSALRVFAARDRPARPRPVRGRRHRKPFLPLPDRMPTSEQDWI